MTVYTYVEKGHCSLDHVWLQALLDAEEKATRKASPWLATRRGMSDQRWVGSAAATEVGHTQGRAALHPGVGRESSGGDAGGGCRRSEVREVCEYLK